MTQRLKYRFVSFAQIQNVFWDQLTTLQNFVHLDVIVQK